MSTIQPRYIPRNPDEVTSLTSSIEVVRTSDNAVYLATRIPTTVCKDAFAPSQDDGKLHTTKLAAAILPAAAESLSLILNHPNIISLVDIVYPSLNEVVPPLYKGKYNDITVWEDMDAGSLAHLLPDPRSEYPDFHEEEKWFRLAAMNYHRFSLPESLCWHVLKSMSNAVLWLHHGVKETADLDGDWLKHDDDWMPVLIRDLSPGKVWFKKARGGETYGECKLGGFESARVTGIVGGRMAVVDRIMDATRWQQYYWAPEIYNNSRSWTRASEIWALGAILYTMMTGIPPPRNYDYNWQVSRLTDKGFSQPLREIVGAMLKHHPADRPHAMDVVSLVNRDWPVWRSTTTEGRRYRDLGDEAARKAALGLRMGLGESTL